MRGSEKNKLIKIIPILLDPLIDMCKFRIGALGDFTRCEIDNDPK